MRALTSPTEQLYATVALWPLPVRAVLYTWQILALLGCFADLVPTWRTLVPWQVGSILSLGLLPVIMLINAEITIQIVNWLAARTTATEKHDG